MQRTPAESPALFCCLWLSNRDMHFNLSIVFCICLLSFPYHQPLFSTVLTDFCSNIQRGDGGRGNLAIGQGEQSQAPSKMCPDQISRSVVSDSLRPHKLQHARPPCPSPTPGLHSDSCPLSQWCHPAISSSVVPFSSCPQSLPASESFPMSQLFTWGGQSTGVSALASFPPKKSQGWSPSEWTGWISLQSKRLSRVFSNTTV